MTALKKAVRTRRGVEPAGRPARREVELGKKSTNELVHGPARQTMSRVDIRTRTVTLMTRSRSTWTDSPRFRPLQTGFSRPAAAASLWYSCAGATRSKVFAKGRRCSCL